MSKPKALTKSQLHSKIADETGLAKKDVAAVFAALESQIRKELRGRAGQIKPFAGLTLRKKDVPAKPAREGRNPFTGEMMTFKAKPASKGVKASVQKALKEMVQ